jgi:retron-type reverse transcriptase
LAITKKLLFLRVKRVKKINDKIYNDTPFKIERGVKQGGIISPFLFNIYKNALIEDIINDDCKTLLGNSNIPILAYADDNLLISYSLNHLENMLAKCDKYGEIWKIKFNPNKAMIMQSGNLFMMMMQLIAFLMVKNLK